MPSTSLSIRGVASVALREAFTRTAYWVPALLLLTPTLVLHARDDAICPIAEGRLLAAAIPGAEFVELDSRNHILLEHEPTSQATRCCS